MPAHFQACEGRRLKIPRSGRTVRPVAQDSRESNDHCTQKDGAVHSLSYSQNFTELIFQPFGGKDPAALSIGHIPITCPKTDFGICLQKNCPEKFCPKSCRNWNN